MQQVRTPRGARWTRPLALVSAVLSGVLAGAMVLIQVVLVPFWRDTPPAEFRRWFTANVERIRRLMIPLGMAAGAVSAASAVAHLVDRRQGIPSVAAAVATGGVIAITLTVNEPANDRFTAGSLSDAETQDLLRTWARWHHVRVVLGLAAAGAAASALAQRDGNRELRSGGLRNPRRRW
jgi:uncharacterized membrane protein